MNFFMRVLIMFPWWLKLRHAVSPISESKAKEKVILLFRKLRDKAVANKRYAEIVNAWALVFV